MNGRKIGEKGEHLEKKWQDTIDKKNPKIKSDLEKNYINSELGELEQLLKKRKQNILKSKPSLATRQCSMAAIESISAILPQLIGGSADLSGSNNTKTNNSKIINSKNFNGNYIHYGVREHGMAAVMNGLALYGGLIPYRWNIFNFFRLLQTFYKAFSFNGLKSNLYFFT